MHAFIYLLIYYFLATFHDFSCDVHDGLIYKLTNHEYVAKCSDVTMLATSYFTRNVFGKCLPILYKNRSPGKSKQDIHLIVSVFIYSNIIERINKVLKKIGNRPETAKSAPSPLNCSLNSKSTFPMFIVPQNCLCSHFPSFVDLCYPGINTFLPLFPQTPGRIP